MAKCYFAQGSMSAEALELHRTGGATLRARTTRPVARMLTLGGVIAGSVALVVGGQALAVRGEFAAAGRPVATQAQPAPASLATAQPSGISGSWTPPEPIDSSAGTYGLTGVSCPASSFCAAVDGNGNALNWNGVAWSRPSAIDPSAALTAVSCTGQGFCAAVDDHGSAFMWNGRTWSGPIELGPPGTYLTALSCSSPSFCIAADTYGDGFKWSGAAWFTLGSIDSAYVSAVSCTSTSFCQAVDTGGSASTWNGYAFSSPSAVYPNSGFASVSCSQFNTCMALTATGAYVPYNGNNWESPGAADSGNTLYPPTTVSCPLPYACYAVDAAGNALSWNGVTWSKPASVDPNRLEAVSCATQYFCMAVDSAGDALTYDAPVGPSLSSLSPASGPLTGTTTVTITGKGLSGATSVDFGSVPAKSFTVVSPEEIQAQSPAGTAGEVPVVVSTPSGSSSPAMYCGDAFYYGGALPSPVSGPLTTMAPLRITDTRTGSSYPKAGHAIDSCSTLDVAVQGVGNIPSSSVGAVVANVTVVSPTAAGYLTLYPKGSIRPLASAINFTYGETVANRVEVPLDPATGEISVYNGSDGSVNVVIDVEGYVLSQSATGSYYNPVNPLRICDTRANNPSTLNGAYAQCNAKTLSPGNPLTVQVSSLGTIPTGATAVEVTLTATNGASSGYLSAYPAGQSPPTSSDLNFAIGETIANSASVELSPTGTMDLVSNARTDVIVDVEGYYASVGKSLEIVSPVRLADTRPGSGEPYAGKTLSGGSSLIVQVAGASVPQGAVAAAVNLTIVGTNYDGYMTAYPPGSPVPTASNVNWYAGTNISALATPKLSSSGGLALYDAIGQANVIVDLEAFYD